MDNLGDLLDSNKYSEPPEIKPLKAFIQDNYHIAAVVRVENSRIVISVPSSALAANLYSNIPKLQEVCNTDKKIVVRTGE